MFGRGWKARGFASVLVRIQVRARSAREDIRLHSVEYA